MKKISTIINKAMKSSWKNIRKDYENNLLCEEGSMQSAFYYHLRTQLKEYIDKGELQIWTEYHISNGDYLVEKVNEGDKDTKKYWYIDLAVVSIGDNLKNDLPLKFCVNEIYALVEFKFVYSAKKKDSLSDNDITKLINLTSISYPKNPKQFNKDKWTHKVIPEYKYIFGISEFLDSNKNLDQFFISKYKHRSNRIFLDLE